jgi:predicted acetyltransferase
MVMTVKYLSGTEKQESRSLWEEAFPEDSKSFGDYYYAEKVKDNRILAIVEGSEAASRENRRYGVEQRKIFSEQRPGTSVGQYHSGVPEAQSQELESAAVRQRAHVQRSGAWRVDAMIQLNPYQLHVDDLRWNVDYIVGVATRKDKRHRGYMSTLLSKMMTDMKKDQVPFCFLMPADPAIYRPFGFTYIFDQPKWKLDETKVGSLKRKPLIPESDSAEYKNRLKDAAEWLENWLKQQYQVYAVRDEDYIRRLAKEIVSENGYLDVLYEDDHIVGLQSAWGWDKQEQRLLYVKEKFRKKEDVSVKPAIMARIISPEVFVKAIRLKDSVKDADVKLQLQVEDPLIEENNRTWIWTLNHTGSKLERVYEDVFADPKTKKPEADLKLTITEMTEWLFGYRIPEQARAYTDEIAVLDKVFLDEVV